MRFASQMLLDAHPRRRREVGRRLLPSSIARLQRRATSIEFSSACGMSANSSAISSWRLKYCSAVKRRGRALVAEDVSARDAHARLVRLEVLGIEELHRVRRHHRQAEPRGEPHRARDQRFGIRLPGALELEVVAAWGKRSPTPARGARRPRHGLHAAPACRPAISPSPFDPEPVAGELGPAAVLVAQPGARKQVAQAQVAGARRAQQQEAIGLSRSASFCSQQSAPMIGLTPLAGAAR